MPSHGAEPTLSDEPDARLLRLRSARGRITLATVTLGSGVAMLDESMDLDSWKKTADDALYAAKAAGRRRVIAASGFQAHPPAPAAAASA